MAFSLATGTFKGKVTEPANNQSHAFSGVVFQKQTAGYGYLLGIVVRIDPGAEVAAGHLTGGLDQPRHRAGNGRASPSSRYGLPLPPAALPHW